MILHLFFTNAIRTMRLGLTTQQEAILLFLSNPESIETLN